MKVLSFILFTAALTWSWFVINQPDSVPFETHAAIQEKLAEMIQQAIQSKKPTATQVTVEKVWTEVIDAEKLRAHFLYSFVDGQGETAVNSRIQGEGILKRDPTDTENDKWVLTQIKTLQDTIEFKEDLVIMDGAEPPATEQPAAETTPTTDAPTH